VVRVFVIWIESLFGGCRLGRAVRVYYRQATWTENREVWQLDGLLSCVYEKAPDGVVGGGIGIVIRT
jgi:hypothetical protein